MTRRSYPLALLVIAMIVLGVAWVAGRQSMLGAPAGPRSSDAVRLGPESGQPVPAYLAGLASRLPAPGDPPVPALVQFTAGLDTTAAAELLEATPNAPPAGSPRPALPDPVRAGTPNAPPAPVTAVFRVPLTRVQTALRFQPLAPVTDPDPVAAVRRRLTLAQATAQRAAAADAARLTGRPSRVAAAEAAALGRPDCRCLLAVLVSADRAGLAALALRPGVRAVDAAPVGTPEDGVALAPLLPEQVDVAGPVPDDGRLPP
jgi:hypothetical protein